MTTDKIEKLSDTVSAAHPVISDHDGEFSLS